MKHIDQRHQYKTTLRMKSNQKTNYWKW